MGKRGPQKTPTALLEKRGSWRAKQRKGEPAPASGDIRCPSWLDPYAKAEWKYYRPIVEAMGVFTVADRGVLALLCECLGDARRYSERLQECRDPEQGGGRDGDLKHTANGGIAANPYVKMKGEAVALAHRYMRELGLTPSARAGIQVEPAKPDTGKDTSRLRLLEKKSK